MGVGTALGRAIRTRRRLACHERTVEIARFLHCAFETAAATASGVRAGLAKQGIDNVTVVAWAGDGGTFDIGLRALSAAAERNEDILYVCYDNEAYMNTGIQRSSATPAGAWTTTTPAYPGKPERKKDLAAILAAHGIPYFATACVSYVDDFLRKFRRAKATRGFRMIHLLSPCTAGWKHAEADTIELGFLAVRSRVFPLFEVTDAGRSWRITLNPPRAPLQEYLRRQGRFSHLREEDLRRMEAEIDERWEALCRRASLPEGSLPSPPAAPAPRTPLPGPAELAELLSRRGAGLTLPEIETACEVARSLWNDPSWADRSEEEILSQAILQAQLLRAS